MGLDQMVTLMRNQRFFAPSAARITPVMVDFDEYISAAAANGLKEGQFFGDSSVLCCLEFSEDTQRGCTMKRRYILSSYFFL